LLTRHVHKLVSYPDLFPVPVCFSSSVELPPMPPGISEDVFETESYSDFIVCANHFSCCTDCYSECENARESTGTPTIGTP